jgi:carboxypeptidase Taq
MQRAQTDCPALETELARGEYGKLLGWLREKVHRHGMRHHPQELMRLATGEGTNTAAHLAALRKKYGVAV